jgi:hypothetical protein
LTKSTYLQRLKIRRQRAALKNQILFGIVLGWLLALVGGFHVWFLPGSYPWIWSILMKVGILLLSLGVILPTLLAVPESLFSRLTQPIGRIVFSGILTICYVLLVIPVGLLMQKIVGTKPFYQWHQRPNSPLDGWAPVLEQASLQSTQTGQQRSLFLQIFWILAFFIRRRNYFLLPLVLLLLTFGLVMFFVQATGIAPLIYTLF